MKICKIWPENLWATRRGLITILPRVQERPELPLLILGMKRDCVTANGHFAPQKTFLVKVGHIG